MSDGDIAILVAYLTGVTRTDHPVKLFGLFSREILLFLASFHGEILRIPRIQYLLKSKHYVKIYNFIQTRGLTDETIEEAAHQFGVRVSHVKAVYAKVLREICKIVDGKVEYPKTREIDKVIDEGEAQREKGLGLGETSESSCEE